MSGIAQTYREFPVWLFYWWRFHSSYGDDLRKYRHTIVYDEQVAAKNNRRVSPEPLQHMGKMIDAYKTW